MNIIRINGIMEFITYEKTKKKEFTNKGLSYIGLV